MKTYRAIDVANTILGLAEERGKTVTPMQLIKLCYMCHGWMLGIYGRPLINESVQAWRYGPVVRSVYQEAKKFRDQPVVGRLGQGMFSPNSVPLDEAALDIVTQVYEKYGDLSGISLSSLTHQSESPWHIVWTKNGQINAVIPNDLIEDHYSKLYKAQPS